MNPLPVYLIDTSYLLELFAVPGNSTEKAVAEVRKRISDAARNRARLYVAVPSIYQLASHISDVANGNLRVSLAEKVRDSVLSSLDEGMPWTVLPSREARWLRDAVTRFADTHVREGIDLTDGTLIDEALRLKQTTYRGPAWRVHIWTKDRKLKAREPDSEPDAFLG
ncbi:MAG: hypothetical protein OXH50_11795 [Gemmatimonadetes bacterium]|nr:hypothetical protein [Gemmatimonadota bacterium]